MATLRLFASIREVAGVCSMTIEADTVEELVASAIEEFGPLFAQLVPTCRVWVNGDQAVESQRITSRDEVALLPPVSGG